MGKFYAVHRGKRPGIYESWAECKAQISGFKNCCFRSFTSKPGAQYFFKNGKCKPIEELKKKAISDKCKTGLDENALLEIFDNSDNDFSEDDTELPKEKLKLLRNTASNSRKRTLSMENVGGKKSKLSNEPNIKQQKKDLSENKMNFTYDDAARPVVFTDGACSNNGKKKSLVKAGYGVWWGNDHPLNISCELKGVQTNQRAEIAAINAALEQAIEHNIGDLTIKTDSMFVINCVTKWIPGWRRRGWIKADGKPVIHKVEFLKMLSSLEKVKVNWVHVRGHQGIYGNEMADRLAVLGASL